MKATSNESSDGMTECSRCEIDALNAEFARSLDGGDIDSLVSLFTEDAVYDNGRVRLQGRSEIEAWFRSRASNEERTTRHMWSSMQVLKSSGDAIQTLSTWMVFAANEKAPTDTAVVGNVADFSDELCRVEGALKLHRRTIRSVFRNPSVAPPAVK